MQIQLYTDGAAKGNPGPGGYGVVLIFGEHRKEMAEGYRLTTNNRMELLAVIRGLESLKTNAYEVIVYSDSKYVTEAINQNWLFNWEKKGISKKKNSDLWIRFLKVYRRHKVKFVWVKGHASNKENNRCDELAVAASNGRNLLIDAWFEANKDPGSGLL